MKLSNLVLALSFSAIGASAVAADRIYTPVVEDDLASTMFERWGKQEGLAVIWEADFDIELPVNETSSKPAFEITAASADEAILTYLEAVKKAHKRDGEKMPSIFGCFYKKARTFVVRQEGQPKCGTALKKKKL